MDRWRLRTPVVGEIWIKYQVAQFARVLGTLLVGGIPLLQALDTASSSLGTRLLKNSLAEAGQRVKEGQALSGSLQKTGIFPGLSIDMIEVGESTGALPQMLASVAEFYEDDVNTRMTAALSLIEPAIMICMGCFRDVRVGGAISADLLLGGHVEMTTRRNTRETRNTGNGQDSVYSLTSSYSRSFSWPLETTIKIVQPADEIAQAKTLAARYRCDFVDLREVRIDHDLFHSVPVDLMFRYNFVPIHSENGHLDIALADPRNLNLIDELAVLLQKKLHVKVATLSQISDLLKKTEQSQRVLEEVTEGFTLDVIGEEENQDETLSIDKLTADSDIAPVIKLVDTTIFQRAGTARQRYSHRNARSGSGHQVPHRRRAALRHAAHFQGLAFHHHFAHQGDERAGHRRAPHPAGRPFPGALQEAA